MADIKIAGVWRAGAFSPNHIGNDAAIMNLVADQLRKRGCEVVIYSEDKFNSIDITEPVILNMCREQRSIAKLQQLEDAGALVINSGYGIENCTRERSARILLGMGVPYAESFIVDTDEVVKPRLVKAGFAGCWIKRGDGHTKHGEDVTFARNPQEAQEILQEFFLRGIKRAVINRHMEGELLKFYGVADTSFFYWYYPYDTTSRTLKAGIQPQTEAFHAPIDPEALQRMCARSADLLDVKIYGGECIVALDGTATIIDFNDWPSFAPCRVQAAPVIARMVINDIKKRL